MKNKIEEGAAWTKKAGKNPKGGLNAKGRKSYERENPGSDLKAPQPQGGARKKSFCARMSGMRKRQKDSNNTGKDRLSLSLKKWNCSTEIVRDARIALAEACWKGYTAYGMKMKNGKQVPNCAPTKASTKKKTIEEASRSATRRTRKEAKNAAKKAAKKAAENSATNAAKSEYDPSMSGEATPFDWSDIDARIAANNKAKAAAYQAKRDRAVAVGNAPEDVEVAQAAKRRKFEDNKKEAPLPGSPGYKPDEVPEKKPELTLRQRAAAQTGKTLPGDPGYDPESQAKIAFDRKQSGRARVIDIRNKRAAAQAAAQPAKEEQPEVEKFSGRDKFRRLVRNPKINQQIDNENAKKKEPTVATEVPSSQAPPPNWYTARSGMNTQTGGTRRSDSPYQSRRTPLKPSTGGNVASAKAVAARIKEQPRKAAVDNLVKRNDSTEIVKKGRMALAEKVLEALSPDETKADPKTREKRMKKGAKAVKNRADKVIGKAKPAKKPAKKAKHTKRDSQGRAGGLHDDEGVPVNISPNHPDYLKKKLYKRATKDGGYGKAGKASDAEPIEKINRRGLTNKSKAKQQRAEVKFAKLDNAPSRTKSGKDYAKSEYDPSMSKDTTWGDDED